MTNNVWCHEQFLDSSGLQQIRTVILTRRKQVMGRVEVPWRVLPGDVQRALVLLIISQKLYPAP